MRRARVVGAGLSGLAAAWHLADRGFDVTVIDAASSAGGLIQTHATPHGLVETGANAFVWNDRVAEWFARLDLAPVFPLPASQRRYIFRDGDPRRWPLSIVESANMAAHLGWAWASRAFAARDGESMAGWGGRVLGGAATEWLLEPAMQGIYAAPTGELSAAAIFAGRTRGPRRLAAPANGMGEFIVRLHERLAQRGVHFEFNASVDSIGDDTPTVVATGAASAARVVAHRAPAMAERLAAVRVAPLATLTMFFAPHPRDLHGFGVLFPRASGMTALGVLNNTDIFAGRGSARSETWIIGDRDQHVTQWSEDRLHRAIAEDRFRLAGRNDEPLASRLTRWEQAIPIYDENIPAIAGEMSSLPPGLALAGNYLGRIGVAALLDHARAAADRVAQTAANQ
jgi:oxygen-dependent protoporphyrinogen oxidase